MFLHDLDVLNVMSMVTSLAPLPLARVYFQNHKAIQFHPMLLILNLNSAGTRLYLVNKAKTLVTRLTFFQAMSILGTRIVQTFEQFGHLLAQIF